ncbi:hypothetical protein DFJ77DRAFT_509108 [Powellomyces hirtus]|nr:hypothetical protein DFJ77DRAFT_509108 [Powellomyces hirtus]
MSSQGPHPSNPSPEAIAQRRSLVDAKFGPGAWENSKPVRPHRCNGHVEDFMVAVTTWPMNDAGLTFRIMAKCFFTEQGKEPERHYKQPVPFGQQLGQKRGMWWSGDENTAEQEKHW